MAWYLRKSLNLGPIRINLSKSGLGLSAGVKGLRVGTGPRGKYLHAGREGVYYRASLDGPSKRFANAQNDPSKVESAQKLNDVTEINGVPEDELAAARWARINARAERLRGSSGDSERGFLSALIGGFFGGLLRGR